MGEDNSNLVNSQHLLVPQLNDIKMSEGNSKLEDTQLYHQMQG